MTPDELRDYNKLSKEAKDYYDWQKGRHPNWSHLDLMNRVAIEIELGNILNGTGTQGIRRDDPIFWKNLIVRVDQWFNSNFPSLYLKVKDTFQMVVSELSGMIRAGIKIVGNFLERLFNLFN